MKVLRFSQARDSRRVVDMDGRTAAAIIGVPCADLREGERVDAIACPKYGGAWQVHLKGLSLDRE
jgi:hypothetical protein